MSRILLLILLTTIQSTAQIVNGGFEELKHSKLGVVSWDSFDNPQSSWLDSTQAWRGKYAMRLGGGRQMTSFAQHLVYNASSYEQIWLKAQVKTQALKGTAGLLAIVTRPNGTQGYVHAAEGVGIRSDTGWISYSIPVIVEPGVNKMFVGGVIHGEGNVWFDEMELTTLSTEGAHSNRVVRAYVKEFLTVIRKHALAAKSVDLDQLESVMQTLTRTAKQKQDCHAAFQFGLRFLGDGHSMFFVPEVVASWKADKGDEPFEFPTGDMVQGVGYIRVPPIKSGNDRIVQSYADSLQHVIQVLDSQNPAGWIIDLRDNSGGNCWPMIAGLGPLIENEVCGYFFRQGAFSNPIIYSNGASRLGKVVECQVTKHYSLRAKHRRVAVLVGRHTASSGELVAVCFAQRPNTVLVGSATSGITTNNSMFTLSDGAVVNLTTAIYADRTKKKYPSGITPEIQESPDEYSLGRSLEWIKGN